MRRKPPREASAGPAPPLRKFVIRPRKIGFIIIMFIQNWIGPVTRESRIHPSPIANGLRLSLKLTNTEPTLIFYYVRIELEWQRVNRLKKMEKSQIFRLDRVPAIPVIMAAKKNGPQVVLVG